MYAAYHSGQFASLWPSRASYVPWAASARRNAFARSFADAKPSVPPDHVHHAVVESCALDERQVANVERCARHDESHVEIDRAIGSSRVTGTPSSIARGRRRTPDEVRCSRSATRRPWTSDCTMNGVVTVASTRQRLIHDGAALRRVAQPRVDAGLELRRASRTHAARSDTRRRRARPARRRGAVETRARSRTPIAARPASAKSTSTPKRAGARIAWNPNTTRCAAA